MRRPVLTRELAHAAMMDAGNRSARRGGRKAWNEADYNEAVRATSHLFDKIEREEREASNG